jgi:hypothetical protein
LWPGTAEAQALGMDLNEFYTKLHKIFFIKPKEEIRMATVTNDMPFMEIRVKAKAEIMSSGEMVNLIRAFEKFAEKTCKIWDEYGLDDASALFEELIEDIEPIHFIESVAE